MFIFMLALWYDPRSIEDIEAYTWGEPRAVRLRGERGKGESKPGK
jgi:hypothetical protein